MLNNAGKYSHLKCRQTKLARLRVYKITDDFNLVLFKAVPTDFCKHSRVLSG